MESANKTLSAATRKIYGDDWAVFCDWCAARNAASLPAAPSTVATYLASRQVRLGHSGLRILLAAMAFHHRQASLPWSAADEGIAAVLRDSLASQTRVPASALTGDDIRLLLSSCDAEGTGRAALSHLRDRALLLTGFAGGLRRSELVALDREDLQIAASGLTLHIRGRKADRDGRGNDLLIGYGTEMATCPVRAMENWLRHARIDYGPVFPRLTAAGTIEGRLTGNGVWKIFRRRAALVGLQAPAGERLSPQGLRAGFAGAQDTSPMPLRDG